MKLSEERLSTVILYSAGNEWRFKGSTPLPAAGIAGLNSMG
jgi:hypothetical protein